ncbi:conserved hypothetical protein, partial [Ricinus communis]
MRQKAYSAQAGSRTARGSSSEAAKKEREPSRSRRRQAAMSWAASCSDMTGIRHQPVEHARRRQHAGQTGARVRSGADQIEPFKLLAAVVRTEPGALGQHRLQPEGRALERQQTVAEIDRRGDARGDDAFGQPREQRLRQTVLDRLTVALRLDRPVGAAVQVGHRRQHVEGVAAVRRQRRIGRSRPMQVEAEIVGQQLALEDVVQQRPVARAEQYGVVRHRVVATARAEVPDEQAHRIARVVEAAIGPALAPGGRQQVLVGIGGVGVRHHDIGRQRFAAAQPYAGGAAIVRGDLDHFSVAAHAVALPLDQTDQPADQTAGAAHREVHAPLPLQMRDQSVDRRDGERVAADEQRMKAQHEAQPLVAHMTGHQAVQAAVALQLHHRRQHARHVDPAVEGHVAQLFETDPEGGFAGLHEALVAGHVVRRQPRHLASHRLGVAGAVEGFAVVEADAVEGRQRSQIDVVGHPPAAQLP